MAGFPVSILHEFLILTFTLLFLFVCPIVLTFFIPIFILRFFVSIMGPIFNKDLHRLIHSRSSVLAQENLDGNPKLNLCVWLVLEGNLNFENFRKSFLQNQVHAKTDNGEFKEPEYQQYYSSWCGFLFWKWDRQFHINNHMRYYFESQSNFKEKQTTEEELRQILKNLAWQNFPAKRSPWEFLYIANYSSSSDESAVYPKSVLILRLHHGFCDGYKILHLLMKEVNGISMNYVQKPRYAERNLFKKVLLSLFFIVQAPYQFFTMLVQSKDYNEWRKLGDDKLSTPFNAAFTKRIPLSLIKEICKGHGVTFTAVLLSGITTGVREMMIQSGVKVPRNIATLVAVPIPGHPTLLRNHFIFSFIRLPVGIADSKERLKAMERNLQNLKNSASTPLIFGLIPSIGSIFHWMMGCFVTNNFTTALLSNFPGPPSPTYFIADGGSTRVTDMNFIAGCGKGGVGMGFLMMSYADGIRIISQADRSILPNDARVEEMNRRIIEEMELLKASSIMPL